MYQFLYFYILKKFFCLLFLLAFQATSGANDDPTFLPEKKSIIEVIQKSMAAGLRVHPERLQLEPNFIKHSGDWVFISLNINNSKGQPFDYVGTDFYEAAQAGALRDSVEALLKKQNGKWEIMEVAINANDVAWEDWDVKYHAPKYIFDTTCLRPENKECKRLNQIPAPWQGTWHPPIYYNGRYGPSVPPFIIENQKIVWEPCGTGARKVKAFSKFYAKTSGILLEIEGEPCLTEEGHPVSYIHLQKEKPEEEYSTNPSCATKISFYEMGAHAASKKDLALHDNIYTKTNCSAFTSKERRAMLDPIIKAANRKLNAEEIWQLRLHYERLEATGDWVFITAGASLERRDKFAIDIKASDITHFISALLKRNGSTWDVVEIDVSTEKNKEKEWYPKWHKTHHIPQDDKQKRICPEACPE